MFSQFTMSSLQHKSERSATRENTEKHSTFEKRAGSSDSISQAPFTNNNTSKSRASSATTTPKSNRNRDRYTADNSHHERYQYSSKSISSPRTDSKNEPANPVAQAADLAFGKCAGDTRQSKNKPSNTLPETSFQSLASPGCLDVNSNGRDNNNNNSNDTKPISSNKTPPATPRSARWRPSSTTGNGEIVGSPRALNTANEQHSLQQGSRIKSVISNEKENLDDQTPSKRFNTSSDTLRKPIFDNSLGVFEYDEVSNRVSSIDTESDIKNGVRDHRQTEHAEEEEFGAMHESLELYKPEFRATRSFNSVESFQSLLQPKALETGNVSLENANIETQSETSCLEKQSDEEITKLKVRIPKVSRSSSPSKSDISTSEQPGEKQKEGVDANKDNKSQHTNQKTTSPKPVKPLKNEQVKLGVPLKYSKDESKILENQSEYPSDQDEANDNTKKVGGRLEDIGDADTSVESVSNGASNIGEVDFEKRLKENNEQLEALERENENFKENTRESQQKINELQRIIQYLRDELDSSKAENDTLKTQLDEERDRVQEVKNEYEQLDQTHKSVITELKENFQKQSHNFQYSISREKDLIAQQSSQSEQMDVFRKTQEAKMLQLQKQANELRVHNSQLTCKVGALEKENGQLKIKVSDFEGDQVVNQVSKSSQSNRIAKLSKELDEERRKRIEAQKELAGTKEDFDTRIKFKERASGSNKTIIIIIIQILIDYIRKSLLSKVRL